MWTRFFNSTRANNLMWRGLAASNSTNLFFIFNKKLLKLTVTE